MDFGRTSRESWTPKLAPTAFPFGVVLNPRNMLPLMTRHALAQDPSAAEVTGALRVGNEDEQDLSP